MSAISNIFTFIFSYFYVNYYYKNFDKSQEFISNYKLSNAINISLFLIFFSDGLFELFEFKLINFILVLFLWIHTSYMNYIYAVDNATNLINLQRALLRIRDPKFVSNNIWLDEFFLNIISRRMIEKIEKLEKYN